MSKIQTIRDMSLDQLNVLIADLENEIYDLKNKLAMTRKLEKPHILRDKKKDRARAIMILKEKNKG
jgi:large subunit ribosomal protein L29